MTREKAIKIIKEFINGTCLHLVDQEALKTLIPELKESEDERIRKALVWHLKADVDFVSNGVTKAECLAYLEKQKEQKPSINIDQLKSLMLQYLQEAANEKDDLDIEADTDKWAKKILGYDFEQKPADLSEMMVHKEPYIAPVPTPMVADEQKPADDKSFEEWLDDWFQGSKEAGGDIIMSEAEFKNWSRGIRNMYQQKPVEWSEEEYGRLFDIEHYLDGTLQLSPDRRIACIDFLKSLLSQSHWKPSEHQMTILKNVKDYVGKGSGYWGEGLGSLIDDLEKLM